MLARTSRAGRNPAAGWAGAEGVWRGRLRLRPGRPGLGTRRPEGRDRGGEARLPGGRGRAPAHARRGVHQHRHRPVEDAPRGGALPDRAEHAGPLRAELPGQGGHHHPGPAVPHPARHRPRDRDRAQPAVPQRHPPRARHRPVPRPAHGRGPPARQRRGQAAHRQQDRHRHRHPAGAAPAGGLRRSAHRRLGRHPRARAGARLHGGGRRRCHRHRVRLDVRGPRQPGDAGGAARPDARLLRLRDRRGAEVPPARPVGVVPLRRDGRQGRGERPRHHHDAGERQADPGRHGDVLSRPRRAPPRPWTWTMSA